MLYIDMPTVPPKTRINIHIRAQARDRDLIDRAAKLTGTSRSQFIMGASLKAAVEVLLDQITILADQAAFQKVLTWMDSEPTADERAGMRRLLMPRP